MPKSNSDLVREHFSKKWKDYDEKISQAIPFYHESFDTLVSTVAQSGICPKTIFEIGVGTGNLTKRLLERFPTASLVGIDLVNDYILQANDKLSNYKDRISLITKDIIDFDFNENYDLVVTSYVFHHIENGDQNSIYRDVFEHLNSGSMFINVDFVDSSSTYFSGLFDQLRMQYMRECGMDEESIKVDYLDHRKLETPMPLEEQLGILTEIGFQEVECFWKYLNLAVFGGVK